LGNYERYLNITLTRDNNITTGKIYKQVIEEERKGSYLGKTVQGESCIKACGGQCFDIHSRAAHHKRNPGLDRTSRQDSR